MVIHPLHVVSRAPRSCLLVAPPPHTGAGRVSVMSEAALLPQKRASLTGESHDQHLALPSMYCQKKKKKVV